MASQTNTNESAHQNNLYTCAADVQAAVDSMHKWFETGKTLPLHFRRSVLQSLRAYLKKHEDEVLEALHTDLGKAPFEGYATELGIVYDEIKLCSSKLYAWAKPKRVGTPLAHFPSSSKVYPSPFGVVAVLSPWNYPLQLALVPVIDAITAGNCVVLK
ncbi:MAG: aldehyde dehydrogenase family protein, partial [Eggerthellaceae bacterium]|nr:aldehyde dehydrogenase family protein [Eggerthellaceae bacterium]